MVMLPTRPLAAAAMLGPASFAILEAVQSVTRSDHDFTDPMSAYAVGRYGWVQTVAFVVLALGSAAVWIGLATRREYPSSWRASRGLIGVWSGGVLLAAVFPTDVNGRHSVAGLIHGIASMVSFVAALAAMVVFLDAVRKVEEWRPFRRFFTVLTAVAAGGFIIAGASGQSIAFGVAQRIFLATVVVWLVAIGHRLYVQGAPLPTGADATRPG